MATELSSRILAYLHQHPGQSAREIAQALGCEKTAVNSCLYGELSGRVVQTQPYRWALAAGGESNDSVKASQVSERLDTPLAKLCRYYLDCISFDDEGGVSFFAESRYEQNYAELPENPLVTEQGLAPLLGLAPVQRLLAHVRQDRKRLGLVLGYPCYLKRIRSRRGWEGMVVEPLFLFPVTGSSAGSAGSYVLDTGSFSLNFSLVARLSGVEGQAGMEEGMTLLAELDVSEGPPPDWEDLFARLHHLRPDWMWHEAPQPHKLRQEPSLAMAQEIGFFNRAVLFAKEQSPYTVGLEKELAKLQEVPAERYAATALGAWLKGEVPSVAASNEPLLEVIPLNSEQRMAAHQGLSAPLTIITGPPGTGKSQVVTSLLLNAAWKSKKVLFASKNNKAVDVVETRVNALGPRPILLRLGTDRVRAELAQYLLGMLASVSTPEDEVRYRENQRLHEELLAQISTLDREAQSIITQRNTVDELERKVEPLRQELGEDRFRTYWELDLSALTQALAALHTALDQADRAAQPFFTRLFWGFFRNERWAEVSKQAAAHVEILQSVGLSAPPVPTPPNDDPAPWRTLLASIEKRAEMVRAIQRYSRALDTLSSAADLCQIHAKRADLTERSQSLCEKLWRCWLALQPSKLNPNERRLLGDYASVLQLIVQANETGRQLGREVFSGYYRLFPEITRLLPCWAVTSLSANGRIPLEPGFFDLVVIDEASQCDIASALPLLYRAKAAVIIGDPKQLRHITSLAPHRDRELLAKHGLIDNFLGWSYSVTSLFDLASGLCATGQIVALRDHHRSHHEIIEFSNRIFYEGRLRVATKHDRLRPVTPAEVGIRWINVEGVPRPASGGGSVNVAEVEAVCRELRRVALEQRYRGNVGVVTPFRAQANLIHEMVQRDAALAEALVNTEFLAETVYRFQGDERDLILFSPVVGPGLPGGSLGFLRKTPNLFNVAITRARCCLTVVGSRHALGSCGVDHMEAFARHFDELRQRADEVPRETVADLGPCYPNVARRELVSEWEHRFYEQLYHAGLRPIPQYPVEGYLLDFAVIVGDRHLDLEVDGERYHRTWDGELLLRDQLRNQRLIELGWDVQRFWVYQIRDEPARCVARVKQWVTAGN